MCGFCGILRFEEKGIGIDPSLIDRMSATLTHRGPDDGGIHVEGQIGLGHRRLNVIDIAGGHQPMKSHAHGPSQVVVYNGEIYNYIALRRELESLGHTFRTSSDTEVLLTAYKEWGHQCVDRLNGMFSFAIWDEAEKALFLARDRMGIKPLYYYLGRESFVFASEVRAILASSLVCSELEKPALDAFLSLGYTPCPNTMFKGILKLAPGHTMTVDANGTIKAKTYWNFSKVVPATLSFADAKEKLRKLLGESVQMRLMSEVPLGVFLSGGLDSSAITALMSQVSGQRLKTFSVGCDGDDETNELPYARKIADLFGTEHHEFMLKPYDFLDSIPQMVEMVEEPLVEIPAIALYQIAKVAKPHATVLLSGEGSDEVFGGYSLYNKMLNMERAKVFRKLFGFIPDSCLSGDKLKKYADWLSHIASDRYRGTSADLTERIKHSFYSPEFLKYTRENNYLDETFLRYFGDVEGQPLLSQLLYVDSKTWLPDDLLLKADKMTMATSVELRVPFLDHKIVEFAASLPPEYKINNGEGKFILKKLMEKYLPKEIIYRRKMGFTVPTKRWFAGDLLGPAKDIVFSKTLMGTGWFQRKYLESMFDRHSKGKEDYSRRIFSLLVLYHWLAIFG
jgi:asparagine synthase (glutamine-hydrolysing)